MRTDEEKYNNFTRLRNLNDEIFKKHIEKRTPVRHLNCGRFGLFQKVEKSMFKLLRQINISSPTALRLFLYLIEVCLGYDDDPRMQMNFNVRKLCRECNIKNRKSLYDAVNYLRDKNMIFLIQCDDGKKIRINPSILFWDVEEEDRKMRVYEKEKDRLYGNNGNG